MFVLDNFVNFSSIFEYFSTIIIEILKLFSKCWGFFQYWMFKPCFEQLWSRFYRFFTSFYRNSIHYFNPAVFISPWWKKTKIKFKNKYRTAKIVKFSNRLFIILYLWPIMAAKLWRTYYIIYISLIRNFSSEQWPFPIVR